MPCTVSFMIWWEILQKSIVQCGAVALDPPQGDCALTSHGSVVLLISSKPGFNFRYRYRKPRCMILGKIGFWKGKDLYHSGFVCLFGMLHSARGGTNRGSLRGQSARFGCCGDGMHLRHSRESRHVRAKTLWKFIRFHAQWARIHHQLWHVHVLLYRNTTLWTNL